MISYVSALPFIVSLLVNYVHSSTLPTKEVGIAQSDGGLYRKKPPVGLSEVNDDEVRMNGVEDSSQVHSSTLPTKEVGIAQSDGTAIQEKNSPSV